MGGYLVGAEASPANTAVQEALSSMLTSYLVSRLGVWPAEEFLKILTNNTESPVLIWDNSTRSQLLAFLMEQQRTHIRSGDSDPTYGATYIHEIHTKELIIGGIFIRVFNRQPDFTLENSTDFAVHLLDYLQNQSDQVPTNAYCFCNLYKLLVYYWPSFSCYFLFIF
jgi:DnaJ family protein C protein 13